MPYSDLIRQEGEYNYSANIQFDVENDRKLLRFIPNETTIELLREYFVDITSNNPVHNSRILYGSYGTGKSHFLTVLSILLSKMYSKGLAYNSFIKRVTEFDPNLSSDINAFMQDENRKPYLVVPIVFDFDDFDRCIYFSLKKKLESVGVKIIFKTFFDQAAALIIKWKASPESAARLEDACKKAKVTLADLEKHITTFDKKSENEFQRVFSEMTFGVKYIYEVSNLAETLNQTNTQISSEYSGIVFIFDEFGRYIEDNIKQIKVKAVQDLAEYCDHCEGNNHIILVSHKEISLYTQKFGKSIANEWKKVEGRYKATPINDKQDQCLSLIRNVLVKEPDVWREFCQQHQHELNNMYSEGADFKGFLVDALHDNPFEGGFPLHPIALYALDKLSKKVAQNERTFFTYLASKDDNSLYRFLISHELDEFHFVGLDQIYDYFEPSIKAVQSNSSYEWYKNLQTALAKNHSTSDDDTPEVKILKTITTIGIINDTSALAANKMTLLNVVDCPKEILSNALVGLCESKIIKYSGSYDKYDFFEASIFDVESMIDEESKQVKDEAIVNTLNEEFVNFVLYPYQYNREYKISRVFIPVFVLSSSELSKRTFMDKIGQYCDGSLVMLLSDKDDSIDLTINNTKELDRSIVFANMDSSELKNAVKNYVAIQYLESQKSKYIEKDPSFEKELMYYKKEISQSVFALINDWIKNYDNETSVIVNGTVRDDVNSFSDLSRLASEICSNVFSQTLIVNNELINKNTVSGSISAAKKNAISGILNGKSPEDYYGVQPLSPDYIAIRSVLVKNGFIVGINEVEQNALYDGSSPQNIIQELINGFIVRAKRDPVNFGELFDVLKEPPYGLRNGYMSILFAHVLAPHKKSLIISSHGVEQEVTANLFEEIVRRPDDYSFAIPSWSIEQMDYLDALEQIFKDYIKEDSLSKNRLKAIYEAMLAHYKNVSKFSRTTQKYISDKAKYYRKLLEKSNANYSTFLFKKLNEIGGSFESTVTVVKKVKTELENSLTSLSGGIANSICNLFEVLPSTSLGMLFSEKYNSDWVKKRQKSFDYYTNAFLEFASKVDAKDSDNDIIMSLSKSITGFELLYWNDSHENEFMEKLSEIKSKLDAYSSSGALLEQEAKMTIVTSNGENKSIVFDRTDLGALSKTVKNKINATLNNYGLSVSYDEKVQVILSILEDLMEGK